MRIAILSCFYPFRGGIAQFNASLYGELSRGNVVKAFNFTRQYPSFLFPGKTQYVTADDEAVPVESEALLDTANPFSYIKTLKAIREWGPDLLIMRYWMSWFGPSLGYVSRHLKKDCKIISILDNVIPHEPRIIDRPFTKYFLKGSHGYVTLCNEVSRDLLRLKGDAKYRVLFHPLYSHFGEKLPREQAEKSLGIESGRRNILFFGLIREYKGLDILLEAFGKLGEGYNLIIAGEPYGSFDKYRKLIDLCPDRDHIYLFPSYIRDSEVKRYFSAADVTVLPYRSATQSGISSISYHFEVPMIVTATGGLKETIGDTGTGIVVDAAEPERIREAIEHYFADASVREGCITAIRAEKRRLSWESFCRSLLDFAREL
ncbi:MAG: glycosyltransferase [Bacteroidia bacterium]|nr:glycosyltransferase [Bacteroidia bacterium]